MPSSKDTEISNHLQERKDFLQLDRELISSNKTDHHIFHKKFNILGNPINIISLNIAQPVQEGISIERGGYWYNFHNEKNLQYSKNCKSLESINNSVNQELKNFLKDLPKHKRILSQEDYPDSTIWKTLEGLTEKKIKNFEFVPKNDEFEIVSIVFDTSNDDKKKRTKDCLSCIGEITKDMQNVIICLQETFINDCNLNVKIPILTTCPVITQNWNQNLHLEDKIVHNYDNNDDKIIQSFSVQEGLIKNSLYSIKIEDKEILLYNIHGKYKKNNDILNEFQSNIIPTMNGNRRNNKITIIVGDFNFYLDHKYLHRLKLILKNENIYSDFIYTPDVSYNSDSNNPSTLDGIIYCAPDVETNLIFKENKQLSITQQRIKENEKKTDTTLRGEELLLSGRLRNEQNTKIPDNILKENKQPLITQQERKKEGRKKKKEEEKKKKLMKKKEEANRLSKTGSVQEINLFLKRYANDTILQEEKILLSERLETLKTKEEQQKQILKTKKEQQKIKTILNTIVNQETKKEDITQIFKKHPTLAEDIQKIGNITNKQKESFQVKLKNFKKEEAVKNFRGRIAALNTVKELKKLKQQASSDEIEQQALSDEIEQQIQNKIATINKRNAQNKSSKEKAKKLKTEAIRLLNGNLNIKEVKAFIETNESNVMIEKQIQDLKKKLQDQEEIQAALKNAKVTDFLKTRKFQEIQTFIKDNKLSDEEIGQLKERLFTVLFKTGTIQELQTFIENNKLLLDEKIGKLKERLFTLLLTTGTIQEIQTFINENESNVMSDHIGQLKERLFTVLFKTGKIQELQTFIKNNKLLPDEKIGKLKERLFTLLLTTGTIQEIQTFINENESNESNVMSDHIRQLKARLFILLLDTGTIQEIQTFIENNNSFSDEKIRQLKVKLYRTYIENFRNKRSDYDIQTIYNETVGNQQIELSDRITKIQNQIRLDYNIHLFNRMNDEDEKKGLYNEMFSTVFNNGKDPLKIKVIFDNARMLNDDNFTKFITDFNKNMETYSINDQKIRYKFLVATEQYVINYNKEFEDDEYDDEYIMIDTILYRVNQNIENDTKRLEKLIENMRP